MSLIKFASTFSAYIVSSVILSTEIASAFSIVEESFFGTPNIVGVDDLVLGEATVIGFDFLPDGTPINTPNPASSIASVSNPLRTAFEEVGVLLDANDVAISQPASPVGIGLRSGTNTLASMPSPNFNSTITIDFTNSTSAAGLFVADGPTNEVSVSFFDPDSNLITTLNSPDTRVFLGIQAEQGISQIFISTSASDDYFVEDLTYITPGVPEPATVLGSFLVVGLGIALKCKGRERKTTV